MAQPTSPTGGQSSVHTNDDGAWFAKIIKAVLFAFLWAAIVVIAFAWHFSSLGWAWDARMVEGAVPFAAGAWTGGFLTAMTTQVYGHRRSPLRRFCAFLLLLTGLTLAVTLAIFVLHYRVYFSTWHADFPSVQWGFQNFFTALAAIYLFLGTGVKVFVPLPLACALGFALVHGRSRKGA